MKCHKKNKVSNNGLWKQRIISVGVGVYVDLMRIKTWGLGGPWFPTFRPQSRITWLAPRYWHLAIYAFRLIIYSMLCVALACYNAILYMGPTKWFFLTQKRSTIQRRCLNEYMDPMGSAWGYQQGGWKWKELCI